MAQEVNEIHKRVSTISHILFLAAQSESDALFLRIIFRNSIFFLHKSLALIIEATEQLKMDTCDRIFSVFVFKMWNCLRWRKRNRQTVCNCLAVKPVPMFFFFFFFGLLYLLFHFVSRFFGVFDTQNGFVPFHIKTIFPRAHVFLLCEQMDVLCTSGTLY